MSNHSSAKLFYEYRALITLKMLFKNDFQSATHSDKPDIIVTDKYGIEVTRATHEEAEMKNSYFNKKLKGKNTTDLSDDTLARFEYDDYKAISYQDKVIGYCTPAMWQTTDAIVSVIKKKMDLVQMGAYPKFDRVDLYVFSDSFMEYEKNAVEEIVKK